MSIVIDANVFGIMCSSGNEYFEEFFPVLDWVTTGEGRLVYGGTRYMEELSKCSNMLLLLSELRKANKAFYVDDASVDELQEAVTILADEHCDDQHIIALVGVSHCPLVCTRDERAERFFKDSSLYPWKGFAPKIYKRRKQASTLLTNKYAKAAVYSDKSQNPKFKKFVKKARAKKS